MNEGEGSRTAAKHYNDAQKKFVEAGKVEPAARQAAQAIDGPEGDELRRAEQVGKSKIAEELPEEKPGR
jgi:hypothetical protein